MLDHVAGAVPAADLLASDRALRSASCRCEGVARHRSDGHFRELIFRELLFPDISRADISRADSNSSFVIRQFVIRNWVGRSGASSK